MLEEQAECTVMAFCSEFGSVYTTAEYMCVSEGRLAFCAYEGLAVFPFASVDVYAPGYFQRVPFRPEGRRGVCMYCVVRSRSSRGLQDLAVDCIISSGAGHMCASEFA